MKNWSDIELDYSGLERIKGYAHAYENFSPACRLTSYWNARRNLEIEQELKQTKRLPSGFVGNGWPEYRNQIYAKERDWLDIHGLFPEKDINSRDIGDTIYQTNLLMSYVRNKRLLVVADIGAGYGRLALGFILACRKKGIVLKYYGIDYVPVSLLIAPQFVEKTVENKKTIAGEEFVSLPAWDLERLSNVDLFISVHSFQEMYPETIEFYIEWMKKVANEEAYFYSVNIWNSDKYIPKTWKKLLDEGYPINRDGRYNEELWEIK